MTNERWYTNEAEYIVWCFNDYGDRCCADNFCWRDAMGTEKFIKKHSYQISKEKAIDIMNMWTNKKQPEEVNENFKKNS
jgi:hypothetical protein